MKSKITLLLCLSVFVLNAHADSDAEVQAEVSDLLQTFNTEKAEPSVSLIDCKDERYQPTASHRSLFSWSKTHHEDAQAELNKIRGTQRHEVTLTSAAQACKKAIEMRGAAYCQQPANSDYRVALTDTFKLCTELGLKVGDRSRFPHPAV